MRSFILSTFFFLHSICFAATDEETAFEANSGIVTPIDNDAVTKIEEILRKALTKNIELGSYAWYINSDGTMTFVKPTMTEWRSLIEYSRGRGDGERLCQMFLNEKAYTPRPEKVIVDWTGWMEASATTVYRLIGENSPYTLLALDRWISTYVFRRVDCRVAGIGTPVNRLYKNVEQKTSLSGNSVSIIGPQFSWHENRYSISSDSDLAGVCKGFGYTQYVSAVPAKSINPFAKHVKLDRDGRYVMKSTREFGYLKSIQCEN